MGNGCNVSECPVCPWYARCSGCVLPPSSSTPLEAVTMGGQGAPAARGAGHEGTGGDAQWVCLNCEWSAGVLEGGGWNTLEARGGLEFATSSGCRREPTTAKQQGTPSLSGALAHFTSPQSLSGFRCTGSSLCSADCSTQRLRLWTPPPILVLQLKRFSGVRRKDRRPVSFGVTLDVAPFCCAPDSDSTLPLTFYLYSVIHHFGATLGGGHFEAQIRVGKRWFVTNDEELCEISEGDVVGTPSPSSAYMLIFVRADLHGAWERVGAAPPPAGAPAAARAAVVETLRCFWPEQPPLAPGPPEALQRAVRALVARSSLGEHASDTPAEPGAASSSARDSGAQRAEQPDMFSPGAAFDALRGAVLQGIPASVSGCSVQ